MTLTPSVDIFIDFNVTMWRRPLETPELASVVGNIFHHMSPSSPCRFWLELTVLLRTWPSARARPPPTRLARSVSTTSRRASSPGSRSTRTQGPTSWARSSRTTSGPTHCSTTWWVHAVLSLHLTRSQGIEQRCYCAVGQYGDWKRFLLIWSNIK